MYNNPARPWSVAVAVLLFVYGTLKRGGPNHHFLAGQEFVAITRTVPRYRLHDLGPYPALVEDADGVSVLGEVWRVDADALDRIDWLEGTPELYRRVMVELADPFEPAQTYLYNGTIPPGCPSGDRWPLLTSPRV